MKKRRKEKGIRVRVLVPTHRRGVAPLTVFGPAAAEVVFLLAASSEDPAGPPQSAPAPEGDPAPWGDTVTALFAGPARSPALARAPHALLDRFFSDTFDDWLTPG